MLMIKRPEMKAAIFWDAAEMMAPMMLTIAAAYIPIFRPFQSISLPMNGPMRMAPRNVAQVLTAVVVVVRV